jgi:pimeloyl-ACP methyl ester carboxylesterase
MARFVLVHGAMHGGWCWREVANLLTADQHEVYAPTLTGQGDRRQGLSADVGVTTHVTDITDLLWFEDLTDVHLVLHSYSGILAGPIAERAASRLASVTYLGAFVAEPGESLLSVEPAEVARRYRELATPTPHGSVIPASQQFLDQWGVTDPSLREKVAPRLTDFPFRCLTDPVQFDPMPLSRLRTAYVRHTRPPLASLRLSLDRAVAAGWPVRELEYGHDLMLAAPGPTATVLSELAGQLT